MPGARLGLSPLWPRQLLLSWGSSPPMRPPSGRRLVLSRIPACRLGIRVQRDDPDAEELALI